MEFTFRPLPATWPGTPTARRKRSPFKAGYGQTLRELDHELTQLQAKNVVLHVALGAQDIRLDGRPRAEKSPTAPGVILAFDSKFGELSYPCDTYDDWRANVRAITLSLAALRAVDRYGVTRRAEQYRGWQALPPPIEMLDPASARAVLKRLSGVTVDDRASLETAYRTAAMRAHPDRGGDARDFSRVRAAKELLDKEFS